MKIVIVGCGRVGASVADAYDLAGHEVVILDILTSAFDRLPSSFSGQAIRGDGTDEDRLQHSLLSDRSRELREGGIVDAPARVVGRDADRAERERGNRSRRCRVASCVCSFGRSTPDACEGCRTHHGQTWGREDPCHRQCLSASRTEEGIHLQRCPGRATGLRPSRRRGVSATEDSSKRHRTKLRRQPDILSTRSPVQPEIPGADGAGGSAGPLGECAGGRTVCSLFVQQGS